jgi:hypothetical protein
MFGEDCSLCSVSRLAEWDGGKQRKLQSGWAAGSLLRKATRKKSPVLFGELFFSNSALLTPGSEDERILRLFAHICGSSREGLPDPGTAAGPVHPPVELIRVRRSSFLAN